MMCATAPFSVMQQRQNNGKPSSSSVRHRASQRSSLRCWQLLLTSNSTWVWQALLLVDVEFLLRPYSLFRGFSPFCWIRRTIQKCGPVHSHNLCLGNASARAAVQSLHRCRCSPSPQAKHARGEFVVQAGQSASQAPAEFCFTDDLFDKYPEYCIPLYQKWTLIRMILLRSQLLGQKATQQRAAQGVWLHRAVLVSHLICVFLIANSPGGARRV